ncbi:decarboxylase [Candidatus Pacearchaeota archaeon]|nr:decarboxylase [Candidatus Pacearchaeota archaeon]
MDAKFILNKRILFEHVKKLTDLNLKVCYSYKTNREVGNVLQKSDCEFSIHDYNEISLIKDKGKIWFFLQAESCDELIKIMKKGVKNFVIDNVIDLQRILDVINSDKCNKKINLSLRMKFQEHRVGTGRYFVYGMSSKIINEIIERIRDNHNIDKLGIHLHRKSQNTSEWEIKSEIRDNITPENLKKINFFNLGGGLPSIYRSSSVDCYSYIFQKIKEVVDWLDEKYIKCYIEPGRFLAAPCIKLETEIIQKYNNNLIINTTIYNCSLDSHFTGTKMFVEGEDSNEYKDKEVYLIKGNSPTRDDIFRYNVKLPKKEIGDKIVFINAGAYNYTTDFFGFKKLKTEVVEG